MSGYGSRYDGDGEGYSSSASFAQNKGVDNGESSPYDVFEDRDSQHKYTSRGSDHERSRTRESNRDREKDRDRPHRDYKDRSIRDERGRDKYDDYERSRSHDYDRHHDYDRDRDRRYRHRSRSPSRDKSRNQSRSPSRSRSHSKSKRTSGFDMAPPGNAVLPVAAATGQLPGVPQITPGTFPNMYPMGTAQFGAMPVPVQAMTQQATRHARRVYVGGLPPMANEQIAKFKDQKYMEVMSLLMKVGGGPLDALKPTWTPAKIEYMATIATYFSQVMAAIGGNTAGPGDAVVNVYINHEKKFAFVEMRTVEEASNAMALDGIIFEGVSVRVRRPTDYNPALAAALGPSHPSPNLNLAAVGLIPGAIGGAEGPDRIFVGGLPYYFSEAQIRELLESFGALRGFDLVKDRDTGNSKGYGFCVYQDPASTDVACAALNGLKMGDKTLTVRRATASMQAKPDQEIILAQAQQQLAMHKIALQVGGANLFEVAMAPRAPVETPTKVVCLTEVVLADELRDDEEYEEILEDMREEGGKFGSLVNVLIPRPNPNGVPTPGIGKVFLEYSDTTGSTKAKAALNGRKFGGRTVVAIYYPEENYFNGDL